MDREQSFYLYTKGMSVGYRGVPLIKNIEIGLRKGEILTLIGPNGAGKTTILKSMIRQLALVGGVVYLDGSDMSGLTGNELARRLSVVLTERVRPELMTCEEVVATGRYPYTGRFGVLTEEDRRIVREAMELSQVGELSGRDFLRTSDGQKQRVMLARALCQQPQVLVLDEPTSFLDVRYKLEFLSVIQKMSRERGLAVIMSLHELDLAERVSDKIACVRGDCIDRFGTPEEIFTGGYIPELYGMTSGAYDELTGSPELERPAGEPQVFVIAGRGTGTPVYRRLQREGTPFATGVLWENDLDYPAACGLAAEVVAERAYASLSEVSLDRARTLIRACGRVICTLERGGESETERRLLALAERNGNVKNGSI
ncbi:MAG: ABC transporter ATP-binding protein [Eubacteriales bacterium]|nr:ABC transporter ATP-binding protein [Eubacteriales bacterium]